jgi:1-acyl-sn-glycerol-3-phosphate acyltransferase
MVATALAFTLFGIGGLLLGLYFIPFIALYRNSPELRAQKLRAYISQLFRLFVNFIALVGILEYRVHHSERIRPGQLIVANHPTLLDVVFLVSFIPNAVCVVKESLFHHPCIGFVIRNAHYVSNLNPQSSIDEGVAALEHGESVIIFPEGTRSTPGQISHLQRGAAYVALQANVAMLPIHISCVPSSLTKAEKWYEIPERKMQFDFTVSAEIVQTKHSETANRALAARNVNRQLKQVLFTEEVNAASG